MILVADISSEDSGTATCELLNFRLRSRAVQLLAHICIFPQWHDQIRESQVDGQEGTVV